VISAVQFMLGLLVRDYAKGLSLMVKKEKDEEGFVSGGVVVRGEKVMVGNGGGVVVIDEKVKIYEDDYEDDRDDEIWWDAQDQV